LPVYAIRARLLAHRRREEGSISIEYAMVIIVGVALAGVLLATVTSDGVKTHLLNIVMRSIG
jgi:hypothetical protein